MIASLRLAAAVKERASDLGFDACGIASAGETQHADYVHQFFQQGRHGDMAWLANRRDERLDPRTYLPGARSIIVVATSYNVPLRHPERAERVEGPRLPSDDQTRSLDKLGMTEGKVARYALGIDYHDHLKNRLFTLADWLRTETPCETRVCVDTAPVLESEWAARSGIAWQGKNRLALSTTLGSYLLLGEILTTADLAGDAQATNRCGTCNACIDACPTDALTPYQIDPRRCISTWTIEHRGDDLPGDPHGWLFGCDICQEVCPWNRKAAPATDPLVQPRPGFESGTLDAEAVLRWTPDDFRSATRKSAMRRVKLPQLQRNARAVLSNGRA